MQVKRQALTKGLTNRITGKLIAINFYNRSNLGVLIQEKDQRTANKAEGLPNRTKER
jgi:hypothetical protein